MSQITALLEREFGKRCLPGNGAKEYMQYFQEQEKFPKKTTKDIWEPFDKVLSKILKKINVATTCDPKVTTSMKPEEMPTMGPDELIEEIMSVWMRHIQKLCEVPELKMILAPLLDQLSSFLSSFFSNIDRVKDTDIQVMDKLMVDLQTKEELAINPSKLMSLFTIDSSSKFHSKNDAAPTSNFEPQPTDDQGNSSSKFHPNDASNFKPQPTDDQGNSSRFHSKNEFVSAQSILNRDMVMELIPNIHNPLQRLLYNYAEQCAWYPATSAILAAVDAYLFLLELNSCNLYTYESFQEVLQSGSESLLFSSPPNSKEKSNHLLFPSDSELNPPFFQRWPSYQDQESQHHQFYEESILKLYHEKLHENRWTEMDVTQAYMDLIPRCTHPAEMVVCRLHAAMWMAKELNPQSKIEFPRLYALKCVIIELLKAAFLIALSNLNPGMQLYVSRLVIGIIRKIARVPGSKLVLKDGDTTFLQRVLTKLVKLSQLFPFWEFPSVSVSEASILNFITKHLHSSFIIGLQILYPEERRLSDTDLTYQLHENDTRHVLPLKEPSDSCARAMEELLKSEGRSWSEVVQNMYSSLIQRDEQGWLIPLPNFAIPQKFSKVTGFIVHKKGDCPKSIDLKVVEADSSLNRRGLFSTEDICNMIQLEDLQTSLFFSLDPPDHDYGKHYHPFQQWKYTEQIKDTEILKTMFLADYLMKSFTVGSDISAQPPFQQRSCEEGLTKNLPSKLKKAIRPIHEREGTRSQETTYRFWIEAKEIRIGVKYSESKIEFHFGDVEMIVRCCKMIRQYDGALTDSDEDFDEKSPEAQFAKDMTDNYTELAHHYPVFARLQELCKLQAFVNMMPKVFGESNPFESLYHLKSSQPSNKDKWEWVPAASSDNVISRSYGGVHLHSKLHPLSQDDKFICDNETSLPLEVIIADEVHGSCPIPMTKYSAPNGFSVPRNCSLSPEKFRELMEAYKTSNAGTQSPNQRPDLKFKEEQKMSSTNMHSSDQRPDLKIKEEQKMSSTNMHSSDQRPDLKIKEEQKMSSTNMHSSDQRPDLKIKEEQKMSSTNMHSSDQRPDLKIKEEQKMSSTNMHSFDQRPDLKIKEEQKMSSTNMHSSDQRPDLKFKEEQKMSSTNMHSLKTTQTGNLPTSGEETVQRVSNCTNSARPSYYQSAGDFESCGGVRFAPKLIPVYEDRIPSKVVAMIY